MPKVSIVVPIYGVEKYIERCAISLFSQTLEDIEFIFVNDCTTDSSIEILNNVILKYPHRKNQVKIINLIKNQGLPNARKIGVESATGEYIIHCDSDDWVDVRAYQMLYEKAISGNYDMVFCNYYTSDGHVHRSIIQDFKRITSSNILLNIVKHHLWSVWRVLVKREIYLNNIFYPRDNNGEDFALISQLIYFSKSFSYVNTPLYYYYYNENSITKTCGIEKIKDRINQQCENTKLVENFFNKHGKYDSYFNEIFILKLYCRANYSKYINEDEIREIWFNTFPEIDKHKILFNKNIPFNLKVNYYSVRTGTYMFLKKLQSLIKSN